MSDEKWLTQVKRGLLELCVLNLLERESLYGYQIVRMLTSVPGLVISEGTVYPLMSRLKDEGFVASSLVESPYGPARRTYVLTPEGRRHRRELNKDWQIISKAINAFMIPGEGR